MPSKCRGDDMYSVANLRGESKYIQYCDHSGTIAEVDMDTFSLQRHGHREAKDKCT